MKKLLLFLVLALLFGARANATSYFLATAAGGGNDSNNGTSTGTPWLTPNHALNCGDTITAAASTAYSASNFGSGKWGTVTCSGNNNVAWLQCVTFDACKISTSGIGMNISANYWGVQGWEITSTGGTCFDVQPASSSNSYHHIIFANDIANGCFANGFSTANNGSGSSDYIVMIGNIAYNAAQGSSFCTSGISIYEPQNHDTAAGTHIYVAGNFSWSNLDPDPCAGGSPTDGEGIIFDTFDGSQGGISQYTQQAVAYNNILLSNGGRGFEVFNNTSGSSHATIYSEYNTAWGNNHDTNQNGTYCGEFLLAFAKNTTYLHNLAVTNSANGCGANPLYAYYVGQGDSSDTVDQSWGYSAAGHEEGINNSTGFSYGSSMNVGTNPSFASATTPSAPSCSSATSVPNCMATVISNFTATASGASAYGYQAVSNTSRVDALYPAWLCNVTIPLDLVTPGCGSLTPATITPTDPQVSPSGTQPFTCSANCGTSARWTCPTCTGSVNSSTGVYTAPSLVIAQQSYGGYQLLPNDHIFNKNISGLAAASNSSTLIAAAGTVPLSFYPAFPPNYANGSTPTGTLNFTYTPTNNGTYEFPLWPTAGIEGGWFDAFVGDGNVDHHMIVIDTTSGHLNEIYQPVGLNASCSPCNAASGLKYTSEDYALPANGATDAAGMFLAPLTLKSQEFVNAVATGGSINHALRMTLANGYICNSSTAGACPVGAQQNASGTRHIWPATTEAFAGGGIIPYGTCFRLKSSFNISTFSAPAQVLLTELKNYCMFLADGGIGWQISADFDNMPALEANAFFEIFEANIAPSNFEAVDLSSIEESSSSGATSNGEVVCYTSSTGTTCTNVNLQGTVANVQTNQEYFMVGAPQTQLVSYPSSGVTWSCTNCTGTIQLSGTATGNNYQSTGTTITTASPTPNASGPINSTTGDFVDVIVYALDFGNPTSVTDVCGNTYTHASAADFRAPNSAPFYVSHWYSIGITGCSSNVWTATWGSTAEWMGIQAREYNPNGATITLGSIPSPVTSSGTTTITTGTFNTSANAVVIAAASTQFGGYSLGKTAGFPAENLLGMLGSAALYMGTQDTLISNSQTGITASMNINSGGGGAGMSVLIFSGTGGSSIYGTLTSAGLYTPPSSLVSVVRVPMTVTSTANSSVTSQMNVFVTPSTARFVTASSDYVDTSGNTWFSGGQVGIGLSNSPQLRGCCNQNNSFANIPNYQLWYTSVTSSFNVNDRKIDFHVPANALYQITYNYGTAFPAGKDLVYYYVQGNLYGGGAIDPSAVAGGQSLPFTINTTASVSNTGLLSFYTAGIGGSTSGPGDVSSISFKQIAPASPVGFTTKSILLGQ